MKRPLLYFAIAIGFVAAVPTQLIAQQFLDVSNQVGLISELKKSKDAPIWGDFNNDGVLDLIVSCHGLSVSHGPFVYLGHANGTFTDIRATCGFSDLSQFNSLDSTDWHGMSLGDYNNDGNLDLYIAEGGLGQQGGGLKRDLLFKGRGDGTFAYVSDVAGIVTSGDRGREGFWVDYNNDGKLDLFVKNYITTNGFVNNNHLYRNNGNGTFTETANAGGLAAATFGTHAGSITSFADYDNDGFMDVAFAGESSSVALYRNQHNGTFADVTAAAGFSSITPTQGVAWGDYNNDGLLDLYVASGHEGGGPFRATLYRNKGNGTFTDVTQQAGVGSTSNSWAPIWGDYDNDGFLDLFVTVAGTGALGASPGNANLLFHNNGNGTFTNVAAAEGVQLDDGGVTLHRAAAWGDYNNDGFLDLILKEGSGKEGQDTGPALGLHRLFKNNHTNNGNHFIKANLVGVQSNKRGIGARVTATYTGGKSFRLNNGGGGGEFWSQGSEPLHFGIGRATKAAVQVIWPSGVVDTLPAVAANSTLSIVEGSTHTSTLALSNISTRVHVETDQNILIGGFIITGSAAKTVLIRAIGPSLQKAGLSGVLADPVLGLHDGNGSLITSNDNWQDDPAQAALIEATGIPPQKSLESAIVATLAPGKYTAFASGKNRTSGVGLVEIYDLDRTVNSTLANISSRGFIQTGDNVMIGGFILGGSSGATRILIRALGPSLAQSGVTGFLTDPTLELHNANGDLTASNDNWKTTQQAEIQSTGIPPKSDAESAILAVLPPENYTAIVAGKNGSMGVGLVEVYALQ